MHYSSNPWQKKPVSSAKAMQNEKAALSPFQFCLHCPAIFSGPEIQLRCKARLPFDGTEERQKDYVLELLN